MIRKEEQKAPSSPSSKSFPTSPISKSLPTTPRSTPRSAPRSAPTTPTETQIKTRRLSNHDDFNDSIKQGTQTNDPSHEEKSNQGKNKEHYRQPFRKDASTNLVVRVVPPQKHQEDAYVQFSPSMDTSEQHRMPPSLSTLPRLTSSELQKENKILQRQNQILQQKLQKQQQQQQQQQPIEQKVKQKVQKEKPKKNSSPTLNQKEKKPAQKQEKGKQRRLAEEEENSLLKQSSAILRQKMESLEERIVHLTKLSLQQSTSIADDYSSLKRLSNQKLTNKNNKIPMSHKQNSLTSILTAATESSTTEESHSSRPKSLSNNEEKKEYYDDVTCSSSVASSLYFQKLQRDSTRMIVAKEALLSVVDQQESTLKEYRKLAEPRFDELHDSRLLIKKKQYQLQQLKKTIETKQKNFLIQRRTEESLERQLYYLQKMYLQKKQNNHVPNQTNTKKRNENTSTTPENEHEKFMSYYNINFHKSESELFHIQKSKNKKAIKPSRLTSPDSWDDNPAVKSSLLSSERLKQQQNGYSQSSLCFSSTSEASFEQKGTKKFSFDTRINSSSFQKNLSIRGQQKLTMALLIYPREERFELVSIAYFCANNKSNDDDDYDISSNEVDITNTTPSMQKLLDTVSEHTSPYKQQRQSFRAFCTSHTELLLSNFLTLESYQHKLSGKDVLIAIPETMQKRDCISRFKTIFHSSEVRKAYKRYLNVHRHQQRSQQHRPKDEQSVTCEIVYVGSTRMASALNTSFSSGSSLGDEILGTEKSVINKRKNDHIAIVSSSSDDAYHHFSSSV